MSKERGRRISKIEDAAETRNAIAVDRGWTLADRRLQSGKAHGSKKQEDAMAQAARARDGKIRLLGLAKCTVCKATRSHWFFLLMNPGYDPACVICYLDEVAEKAEAKAEDTEDVEDEEGGVSRTSVRRKRGPTKRDFQITLYRLLERSINAWKDRCRRDGFPVPEDDVLKGECCSQSLCLLIVANCNQ